MTGTDLVPRDLGSRVHYAETLADAGLLPTAYRKQPANVLYAMEYGEALGLSTIVAITEVHVIEGKPSASSGLIATLVRRAGHRLRVTGDATTATAEIVRADDPDFTFRATWTLERARTAGLLGKQTWQKHGEQMLKRRAISEVARDACPEVLAGIVDRDEAEEAKRVTVERVDGGEESAAQTLYSAAREATEIQTIRDLYQRAGKDGLLGDEVAVQVTENGPVFEVLQVALAGLARALEAAAEEPAVDEEKPKRGRRKPEPTPEPVEESLPVEDPPAIEDAVLVDEETGEVQS